jgi:hypothetical protein
MPVHKALFAMEYGSGNLKITGLANGFGQILRRRFSDE